MRYIIRNKTIIDKSIDIRDLLGKKVLSRNGIILGKIKTFVFDNRSLEITGIIVRKNFKKTLISSDYFAKLTPESLILNVDPSFLLKNKRVLDLEGKFLGNVKKVITVGDSNKLDYLVVRSKYYFKRREIQSEEIKSIGESIILKNDYDAKKHFWEGNK